MGKDKTAFDMKVIEEMEKVLEEDVKKESKHNKKDTKRLTRLM